MRMRALLSVAAMITVGVAVQTVDLSTATAACAFSVSSIAPAAAFTSGGVPTIITGCGFSGAGTLSVTFGSAAPIVVAPASDTSLSVVAPANSPGTVTVTVRLHPASPPDSVASTSFTYVAIPTLTSMVPTRGPEKGGTSVEVTGTNLQPSGSSTSVKFGTTVSPTVSALTNTSLVALSPAGTGTQNVTAVVTLTGGATATSNGLSYVYVPAPTVTNVSPSSATLLGGTDVLITGTDFQPGASVFFGPANGSSVDGSLPGDTPARPTSVLSSTSIRATTPVGTVGATNIVVVNPDG